MEAELERRLPIVRGIPKRPVGGEVGHLLPAVNAADIEKGTYSVDACRATPPG